MFQELNDSNFDAAIKVECALVVFSTTWCGPCKTLKPVVKTAAEQTGITVFEIDTDDAQDTAARFGIRSVPTTIGFRNGEPIDQVSGTVPLDRILELIGKLNG